MGLSRSRSVWRAYFWPSFPSASSQSIQEPVWRKHLDEQLQARRRAYLARHGTTFARRWAALMGLAWSGAACAAGHWELEASLALAGALAGLLALIFVCLARAARRLA